MRVTQSMLSNNMVNNLSKSYERLAKLQDQINTQKKYTKPSDDPVAAMLGMGYRTELNQIEQYSRNIGEATNWVDTTDSTLSEGISALQRARELTVQASTGTLTAEQRKTISEELVQIKEHLKDLGDTQLGGKYIFNGSNTNVKPSESGVYGEGEIKLEVFSGISIQVNTNGQALFGDTLGDDGSMQKTIDALNNNEDTIDERLKDLDETIDLFLSVQAQVGARQNRVDLMSDRLKQQEVFATEILSKNEDIDIEKAILNLTTQESLHNAALSVGAKIIQPSLLDFLR
ncbi:flagellar hook-associated protein FlgL [Peribacillus psychrosaccharolyticus]|uniref:Flagellar hook-associated protein FlgL n=1 Tax=Peribacillus psychrosaccharolyticus TaxID=1407 RepID=A0A974RZ71_PERPY|nr:flagellar hook-associated protein FlgL [Peribacillus psychrosaccharolyticus]MEC2055476.1 flagellar hook-associated protein FlgL [Peribacillus psychrosaccharolyticus]MED3743496.1 flagellar hook-associated protein FlgL [Peribacillus psychrosaccharolyticus]QQS99153.1 flagellar hook-associated protein FlgL [Peribacillus psychrosaccharolyticus]